MDRNCPLNNRDYCINGECKWYILNTNNEEECIINYLEWGYMDYSNFVSEYLHEGLI